jgi:ADP-ribosylation factor-binding protein GGA
MLRLTIQNHSVCSGILGSTFNALMHASDTFLQINDQINTVINRYEAFQKGDYVTSSNPIPAELGGDAGALSLIDLDDSAPSGGMDDLAGLFVSSNGFGAKPVASPQPAVAQQFWSIMLPGTPTPQAAHGQRAASNSPKYTAGKAAVPVQRPESQPSMRQEQGKDPFADLVGLF